MEDTGNYNPIKNWNWFEEQGFIPKGKFQWRQIDYPNPLTKGMDLYHRKLVAGFADDSFSVEDFDGFAGDEEDGNAHLYSHLVRDEPDALAGIKDYSSDHLDELSYQPSLRPYRTGGCKQICPDDPIGALTLNSSQSKIFDVGDGGYGVCPFQDGSGGGFLIWYDGAYYLWDLDTDTKSQLFSSAVHLTECRLFGEICVGNDYAGNVYHVQRSGLTQLTGAKGKGFGLRNEFIITSDGVTTRAFEISTHTQVASSTSSMFPWYDTVYFGQNHIGADLRKMWHTIDLQIARLNYDKDTTTYSLSTAAGDGRYIHGTFGKLITRDWIRKKKCPTEKTFKNVMMTLRYPCTHIAVSLSKELKSTKNWKSYRASGITFDYRINEIIRLDMIRRICHLAQSTSNAFNPTTRVNTNTVTLTAVTASY